MGEERYLYSDEKDREELSRLTIMANIFDPVTTRHLETVGVAEGWNCLEVGAGTGSIAQWLSQRVGPSGRVVATDINTRFLSRMSAPNLEIRRHDILRDELEKNEYNLVHCRKLLEHLPEPEKALRRMADAVRPGGWLLIEEDDMGSTLSEDVTDPSAASVVKVRRDVFDSVRKRGIVDWYFGRRVRGLVEALGYEEVGQEGWTCILRGGDPLTRMETSRWQALIRSGLLTQEEAESRSRFELDPNHYWPYYTMFCAWGRKPMQVGSEPTS